MDLRGMCPMPGDHRWARDRRWASRSASKCLLGSEHAQQQQIYMQTQLLHMASFPVMHTDSLKLARNGLFRDFVVFPHLQIGRAAAVIPFRPNLEILVLEGGRLEG